jgi:hypothetical protein
MVAMWRVERIGTIGRAIRAVASQNGHRDGRILEESIWTSRSSKGDDDGDGDSDSDSGSDR